MPLATQSIIGGSKISFQASTSETAPVSWASGDVIGIVESGNLATEISEKELYGYKADAPGVRALIRRTPTSAKTTISFTLSEMTQLHRDLTLGLDGTGNIGKGGYTKSGWIKVETFDLETGAVDTITARGSLYIDGDTPIAGEDFQLPKFKFAVYGGTYAAA